MSEMIEVTKEDANNYCRILKVLGMEKEGDPVAAVEKLVAASDDVAELAHKAMQDRDSFRAGNTELLELLMKLHAGDHTEVLRQGKGILLGAGLLSLENNRLNWEALEARKPRRLTWAEAVNECVTDPDERARLLAMG